MAERRFGVLIASSRFQPESGMLPLRCPENDADGLSQILVANGDFRPEDIHVLKNIPHWEALRQVNQVLHAATKDDLVLLYYSGHGKQDDNGRLHLASVNTVADALESTSIPIESIRYMIDNSRSNKIVLILDCCYSGAAGQAFFRGGIDDQLQRVSGGSGSYILTASTAVQAAREREGDRYGLLTKHIIEGVQSGQADLDGDGLVTMDELYQYVFEHVRADGPQLPQKWSRDVRGALVIARCGVKSGPAVVRSGAGLIPAYEPTGAIAGRQYGILAVTFGPAGKLLLAAGADGVVQLWDASFRRVCRTHTVNNGPVWSAAIQPGGGAYAWGGNDGTVRIATLSSAAPEIAVVKLCEGPVLSLAFAARGNIVAAGGYGASVALYDWVAGRRVDALPMQSPVVHCLRFSPDGKWLAAASGARVQLYNVEEGEKSRIELTGHRKSVLSLAFSPDGALFASSGRDAAIRIWDAASGFAFQRQLSAHLNSVWALDFSAVPRLLASGSADGTIRIWNPQTGERGDAVDTGHGCVQAIGFNPKSMALASAGATGGIVLWTPAREEHVMEANL